MPDHGLSTERLRLRLVDARDAGLYASLYSHEAAMRWVGPVRSPEEAARIHASVCRHNGLTLPGHRFWVMRWCGTDAEFGVVSLRRDGGLAEIGALSMPEAWNRGATREAFGAVIRWSFDAYRLGRIDVTRPDDAQAVIVDRMLAPLGFVERAAPAGRRHWSIAPPPTDPFV